MLRLVHRDGDTVVVDLCAEGDGPEVLHAMFGGAAGEASIAPG